MSERVFLGRLQIECYREVLGHRVHVATNVTFESSHPDISEAQLRTWALDALDPPDAPTLATAPHTSRNEDHPAGFDWRSVFKAGDVIRHRSKDRLGIVLEVVNYGPQGSPRYELHVNGAEEGIPTGVGCWDPWVAALANDPESIEATLRLGLRGS